MGRLYRGKKLDYGISRRLIRLLTAHQAELDRVHIDAQTHYKAVCDEMMVELLDTAAEKLNDMSRYVDDKGNPRGLGEVLAEVFNDLKKGLK
jgi:hypothetical protein